MSRTDSAPRPQVAFFLPHLGGGGTEKMVATLANGLAARGFTVDMVLVRAAGVYRDTLSKSVHVVDLHARSSYASVPGLVAYLRTRRPQVLVSSLNVTNLLALMARWLSNSPCRVAIRIENMISIQRRVVWKKIVEKALLRSIFPSADKIIAVSKAVAADAAQYTGLELSRIHVIHNPVITAEGSVPQGGAPVHPWFAEGCPPVILGIGRLTPQKDFATLLKAFALVRQERDARLIILGEGDQQSALLALARELKVESEIEMPGFVQNPRAYLKSCQAFVLSSIYEGLPTVLIEALASGCPVISTDCPGGARDILADGAYGHLVPVGDAEAMARAICSVLDGNRKYVDSAWLDQYRIDPVLDQTLKVLGLP